MEQKNGFAKILFTAIGFIIIPILIILFRIIPLVRNYVPLPYSDIVIKVESVVCIIYLLIGLGLYWMIHLHNRGKRINKGLLVIFAIILLLTGLIALDGAAAYWNDAQTHSISIAILFHSGFSIIAGILIFIARSRKQYYIR